MKVGLPPQARQLDWPCAGLLGSAGTWNTPVSVFGLPSNANPAGRFVSWRHMGRQGRPLLLRSVVASTHVFSPVLHASVVTSLCLRVLSFVFVFLSTTDGYNWVQVPGSSSPFGIAYFESAFMLTCGNKVVVVSGDSARSFIVYTSDGGVTWTTLARPPIQVCDLDHCAFCTCTRARVVAVSCALL